MILADDNFATIVEAVREGRGIFDNIRKFLRYLLCSNMGEVLTVFLGVVGAGVIGLTGTGEAVVLPLLATQLLWINLITDTGPALAMGLDSPAADLMDRKPRRLGERVIDARMWLDVMLVGTVTAVVTLLTMDIYLPGGLIEGRGDFITARTAVFTTLVLASLFTCLHARSDTASAFCRLFENPWLWGAIALAALLQVAVVNLGFLNLAFGTAPLAFQQWLVCIAMASTVLWLGELRKLAGACVASLDPSFAHLTLVTASQPQYATGNTCSLQQSASARAAARRGKEQENKQWSHVKTGPAGAVTVTDGQRFHPVASRTDPARPP